MALRKAKVCTDGMEGTFEGYLEPTRWNGWDRPWFTLEESMRIMKTLNAQSNEYVETKLTFDQYLPAFIEVTVYLTDDGRVDSLHTIVLKGEAVDTVDGKRLLFPIGNCDWCWYEVKE